MEQPDRNRWKALVFVCLSLLVMSLDNTVLNVALPSIANQMGATASGLQWIVDAYILVFAALLLTMGALGDRIGRKRVLQFGLVWFGVGSLAAGFARSTEMLIAARAFLGVGGAMVMPATLSIITAAFRDPRERGKAIGIWASVFGVGSTLGPLIGGLLVQQFSWNAVFFINLPVIAAALWGGWRFIAESRDPEACPIDLPGAILSIAGLFALVYGIIEAGSAGWAEPHVRVAFVAAAVLLGAFLVRQATARYPMLPLGFFRNPMFSVANFELVLGLFALFGVLFFMTQYLQSILGFSAARAGVLLLPVALSSIFGNMISARLSDAVGAKWTVALGMGLAAAGLFGLSWLADAAASYLTIAPAMVCFAVGLGVLWPAATESVMSSVPPGKAGIGSAMNDTTRQIGAALGVAVLGTIANVRYLAVIGSAALDIPVGLADALREGLQSAHSAAGGASAAVAARLTAIADNAFVAGMTHALLVCAIALLVAAVVAAVLLPGGVRREGGARGEFSLGESGTRRQA